MSVCGSVAGLLVLLLRRFRKIPRRAIKAFWALPFLRFCLPFGLYSGFGLGKLLEALSSKSCILCGSRNGSYQFFGDEQHSYSANRYSRSL